MSRRYRLDFRARSFRTVLGFVMVHWRQQPWRIAGIVAAVLLSTLADVVTPLFAGQLVDAIARGTTSDATTTGSAVSSLVILIALGLVAVAFRQIAFFSIITLTLKMMRRIAAEAFHRLQLFSTDWHANSFAGSTQRRVTRGMWALDLLNDTLLIALFPSAVMLVGTSILLGIYWPAMGLVIGLGSLIYIGVTVAMALGYVAPSATLANAADTRLGGALADAISNNPVVKAYGAEAREEERLSRVLDRWEKRTRRTWARGTINGGLQGLMMVALRAAILGVGLVLWVQGVASAGDIAFVITTFFVLQGYLRDVGFHVRNLQRSINDMEELVSIHALPIGVDDRPNAVPLVVEGGGIEVQHVGFRYGGHTTALFDNLDVSIAPGERVGLVGFSGSGKSTFVKLIQRLYDVSSGRILIDGQDIAGVTQASLRQHIAIVQQDPVLFHRTLAENIAYGRPGATRDEIVAAARLASADAFIAHLPKGYDTLVGERGLKLSGGERQRVAIARAFLADAPIMILDEATSSLDSESEQLIQDAMERLMAGRTTIVIAHRLSTVQSMDRLLVFERGRIAEQGTHAELIAHGGIYRTLVERQQQREQKERRIA